MTAKQEVLQVINALPEESGVEDAIERLYLLLKVKRGIDQADAGQVVSQKEAKKQMKKWLE